VHTHRDPLVDLKVGSVRQGEARRGEERRVATGNFSAGLEMLRAAFVDLLGLLYRI
jgi:hypothetical protein